MANLSPKEKQKRRERAEKLMGNLFSEDFEKYLVQTVGSNADTMANIEGAIGALVVGRLFGWKVLYLVHTRRTIRKYEKYLGLDFKGKLPWDEDQDVMPERGPLAEASFAFNFVNFFSKNKKASSEDGATDTAQEDFWKFVRREEKMDREDRERVDPTDMKLHDNIEAKLTQDY